MCASGGIHLDDVSWLIAVRWLAGYRGRPLPSLRVTIALLQRQGARLDVDRGLRWDARMGIVGRCLRTPVTTACLVLLAMVYAATLGLGDLSEQGGRDRSRRWGMVHRLNWVTLQADRQEVWQPELSGPFDLWDGEWWRLPLTTLHHANFLHLLLNSLFLATYGYLLERQWGSLKLLALILGSALVTVLPEYLLEQYALGFSGVACAIFGTLWGLRSSRPVIARYLSDEQIAAFLVMLGAMFVLTEMGVLLIANLAHFTGLAYGWLVGKLDSRTWRFPVLARLAFLLAHFALIIPYDFIVRPVGNGRYWWYLSTLTPDGQPRRDVDPELLRRAVEADPQLAGAWMLLAQHQLRFGRELDAWHDLLAGLQARPAHPELWQEARRLWRRLAVSPDRAAAEQQLTARFGEAAPRWLEQVRRLDPPPVLIAPHEPPRPTLPLPSSEPDRISWTPPTDADWWRSRPINRGPLDPTDPHSAVEGRRM